MTPIALQRAESLARIAAHSGAPLSEYAVTLNTSEGFELLEWFASDHYFGNRQFVDDMIEARALNDPWLVLQHFTLLGFPIVRLQ